MDEETVKYDENRFNELKNIFISSFSQIGFNYKTITFIPMSCKETKLQKLNIQLSLVKIYWKIPRK